MAVTEEDNEDDHTSRDDEDLQQQYKQSDEEDSTFVGDSKEEGSSGNKSKARTILSLEGLLRRKKNPHHEGDARSDPGPSGLSPHHILQDLEANSMVQ